MKRIVAITCGTLVLLAVGMVVSIWRANQEPVTHTPGLVETGRAQLHAQLEEAKKTEAAEEKHDWDSSERLRVLVQGHEQRIEKLKDNKEATEIVAYDRDAIDRLGKRIAQVQDEEAARAQAAKEAAERAAQESAQQTAGPTPH